METKKLITQKGDNGLWGYVDSDNNWVIQPQFDDAWAFSGEGIARVQLGNQWFIIKSNGQVQEEKEFFQILKGENGFYGFADDKGDWIIDPIYDHIYPWQELYIVVRAFGGDERWGYFSKKGELLQPLYYSELKRVWYDDGILVAWENGEGTYIFPDGEVEDIDEDEANEEANSMIEW